MTSSTSRLAGHLPLVTCSELSHAALAAWYIFRPSERAFFLVPYSARGGGVNGRLEAQTLGSLRRQKV